VLVAMSENYNNEETLELPVPPPVINFPGFMHLDQSQDEWMMTLEGFIKFQLRRPGNPSAGVGPLKKNLFKIFAERNIPKEEEIVDFIHHNSTEYLRHVMSTTEEYVTIHESIREQVVENAKVVFHEIKANYLEE
jgi:uncharacterized protein YllA (UPF0747 family)